MKKLLKITVWLFLILCLLGVASGAILWYFWSSNLPYIGSLEDYYPPLITEIYSSDGMVIGRFWDEKRIVVNLDQVPQNLINAFVAAEDSRFFSHEGIDISGIARAFIKNLKAGRIEEGGSTITQQVTRTLLLKNMQKTYKRKAREGILSLQIEKTFSKERILFLYLNQIYLGQGAYGVEAAARTYFDKRAQDLTLAECALLAGLPQAPSRYSPLKHFGRAKVRQHYVLERMREEDYITKEQELEAIDEEIIINKETENPFNNAPYFTENIRKYLEKKYGRDILYSGGLKVYTTLDINMQKKAINSLEIGLREFDKREGYRGPLKTLSDGEFSAYRQKLQEEQSGMAQEKDAIVQGIVEKVDDRKGEVTVITGDVVGRLLLADMVWARKPDPDIPYYAVKLTKPSQVLKHGDVILCRLIKKEEKGPYAWQLSLEQEPVVQGAIITLDVENGEVKAMVGGRDFSQSQFNRAIQARRQPGSAFKPIIYASALDTGMTPATIILDAPYISTMNPDDKDLWRPKNYSEKFFGPTLFRTALVESRNVITVKIVKSLGVQTVIDYARKLGIESDLSPDLSLALGSSGLSLLEITTAYSPFANHGKLVSPYFIRKIEDATGQVIEENHPSYQAVMPEDTAFVMTDILKAVVTEGTGWRIKELKRPAAGKTGTTNDLRDAWYIGYTPDFLTGVWVGYDDRRPMGKGETGSRAASPIWLYYMADVLKNAPVKDFTAPESVVFAKIDAEKGLLASKYSKKTVFQAFSKGTEPQQYTPQPQAAKSGQFMQFDMSNPQ